MIATLLAGTISLGLTVAWRIRVAREPGQIQVPAWPDLSGHTTALTERLQVAHDRLIAADHADEATAALIELARLFHANGFWPQAADCWRQLQIQQPQEVRWSYYAADVAEATGDYETMERDLAGTVARDETYSPAWLRLAERQFKTGRMDEAAAAYQHRLGLVPGDPYSRLGLARIDLQKGHRTAGRKQLEAIVRDHPQFGTAHNLLARLLAEDGAEAAARRERWLGQESARFAEASDPWRDELLPYCLTPEKLFMLGTVEFQLGRGDRGRGLFEKAVALQPPAAAPLALLGDLYVKLKDFTAALPVLEKSLELDPHDPRTLATYVNLAEAYRGLDRAPEALPVLDRAEASLGTSFELLNARGVALSQLGRRAEARTAYQAALELNPNDANTNFNLGIALLNDGQNEAAKDHFRRALTLTPTFLPALTMLVRVPMSEGRLDEAKPALDTLFDAYSGVPQVRDLAGRWYDAAIKAAEAISDKATASAWQREARARLAP